MSLRNGTGTPSNPGAYVPPTPTPHSKIELPQASDGDAQFGGTRSVNSGYIYSNNEQIGEGTYGQVFLGTSKADNKKVALKKIRMDTEKEGFPITAIREIKILSRLHHENVVNLREIVRSDIHKDNNYKGSIYMVFDYAEYDLMGLTDTVQRRFSEPQVKCILKQLLKGLAYCHLNGVLHRDLKAANILIDSTGTVKLADFGLARPCIENSEGKFTNRVITLWYRPPELLLGSVNYSSEIDMWSIGCIFAELMLGKALFPGKDETDQQDKIFERLGSPNQTNWPGWDKLPFSNIVVQSKYKSCTLRAYVKRMTHASQLPEVKPAALDLLERLLLFDPKKRISAMDAIARWVDTCEEEMHGQIGVHIRVGVSNPRHTRFHTLEVPLRRQRGSGCGMLWVQVWSQVLCWLVSGCDASRVCCSKGSTAGVGGDMATSVVASKRVGAVRRDGGAVRRDGGAVRRDGGAVRRDGGAVRRDGGAVRRDGGAVRRDGGAVRRDGGAVRRDGGAVRRDGGAVRRDGGAHEYFAKELPHACEPRDLPCRGSSHEFTAKRKRASATEQQAGQAQPLPPYQPGSTGGQQQQPQQSNGYAGNAANQRNPNARYTGTTYQASHANNMPAAASQPYQQPQQRPPVQGYSHPTNPGSNLGAAGGAYSAASGGGGSGGAGSYTGQQQQQQQAPQYSAPQRGPPVTGQAYNYGSQQQQQQQQRGGGGSGQHNDRSGGAARGAPAPAPMQHPYGGQTGGGYAAPQGSQQQQPAGGYAGSSQSPSGYQPSSSNSTPVQGGHNRMPQQQQQQRPQPGQGSGQYGTPAVPGSAAWQQQQQQRPPPKR
ncbi:MAG: hypothetical protein WDW36_004983 [Sanguina aurantia]